MNATHTTMNGRPCFGRICKSWQCWAAALFFLCAFGNGFADDYHLGPGDLLRITVFDHDELFADARVSQSGNITYPLLGEVKVGGLSTRDAELMLARRLTSGGFVKQPQVSILITEYQSQKVSVMGQVAKPGPYPVADSKKVLDVLALAGGVLNDTAAEEATLMRQDGSRAQIDLHKLFDGDPSMNLPVQNGDTVYIQRAPQFFVYGEVQKPGAYKLLRNMNVAQAISTGGGLTTRGTERGAIVKRMDDKGKERKYSVKSSDMLQADDVLVIKESLF